MLQFIIFQLHSLSPFNKLLNPCETAFPSEICCHSSFIVSNVQYGYHSSLRDRFGRLVVFPNSHKLSPVASAWLEESRTLHPQIFCVSTDSSPADWGVAPGWCHCRATVRWGQRLLCLLQSALCLGGRSAGGRSLAHQPDPSHGRPSSEFSSRSLGRHITHVPAISSFLRAHVIGPAGLPRSHCARGEETISLADLGKPLWTDRMLPKRFLRLVDRIDKD